MVLALLLLHRTAAAIACRVVWRAHAISGWWLTTALSQGSWRCFISAQFDPCGTRVVSVLSIENLLSVRIDRISCFRHRFLRCLEQLDLSHFREEKRLSVIDFSMNSISLVPARKKARHAVSGKVRGRRGRLTSTDREEK